LEEKRVNQWNKWPWLWRFSNSILANVSLSVDIFRHCSHHIVFAVASQAYPRLQTIDKLIHAIRQQPSLRKDASSALIGLGEAISANATSAEIGWLRWRHACAGIVCEKLLLASHSGSFYGYWITVT
jgi:hypothetical protein